MQRRAGIIYFTVNGVRQDAIGSFTCGYGTPKREALIGSDGVHGYKETPQVAFIEGEIRDRADLDLKALFNSSEVTAHVEFGNGKGWAVRDGWYAGDATVQTEEANVGIRIEGPDGEET